MPGCVHHFQHPPRLQLEYQHHHLLLEGQNLQKGSSLNDENAKVSCAAGNQETRGKVGLQKFLYPIPWHENLNTNSICSFSFAHLSCRVFIFFTNFRELENSQRWRKLKKSLQVQSGLAVIETESDEHSVEEREVVSEFQTRVSWMAEVSVDVQDDKI